jgi:hypothetical protein
MDPDPDPAILVCDLQDINKKLFFVPTFFCLFLFKGTFTHHFSKIKSHSEVTKQ